MSGEDKTRDDYLRTLIESAKKRQFFSTYSFPQKVDGVYVPNDLSFILALSQDSLSAAARETLKFHEGNEAPEDLTAWQDFKWKVTAFINIQDALGGALYAGKTPDTFFHVWYFYYEGKHLLTESVLCWLNGFGAATRALLRPFLEFGVLQNYFFGLATNSQSYQALEEYFALGRRPKWNSMLKWALPPDAFCRPIRYRLDSTMKGLSEKVAHSYHPSMSPRQYAGSEPRQTIEGLYLWHHIRYVLEAVLWVYYVNFPLLFFPRDTVKKFGFNPPMGLFVDRWTALSVERSLGEDHARFREYALPNAEDTLEWCDARSDLSEEEIRASWDARLGDLESFDHGHIKQVANMRVVKELMALRREPEQQGSEPEWEKIGKKLGRYDSWRALQARGPTRRS